MKVTSCFLTVGHLVLVTCIACAPSNPDPAATDATDPQLPELAEADRDTDGRITLAEYRTWLMPMIDAAARGAS